MKQKHIVKVLLILFSLLLIFLFLAQWTAPMRRERREQRYLAQCDAAAREFDVPLAMVLAVIRTESDFRPRAVSSAGACGLMQLMPETFHFLGEEKFEESLSDGALFDPIVNIRYGTCYLSYLYGRFGSWPTALAAYNAGEGRVSEWLEDPALSRDGALLRIPFAETASYVTNTLSAFEAYRDKYQ